MNGEREDFDELLDVLIADAVLSAANADVVRGRLRDAWVPLGKILRQQGKLSMGQLVEVLQAQEKNPKTKLGEICIARGHCTNADIEAALRVQREVSPHAIDVLVQDGTCDLEKLCRSIARYVRTLESRLASSALSA